MQTRKRLSNKRREVTVEIDLLTVSSIALIVLTGVILFFSVLGFVKSFLGIKSFEVVGECYYEASEIAAGADIKKGDRLYRIDIKEAEEKVLLNCPYVKSIDIKKSFPNKIKFDVECFEAIWYIDISGDYYVLDADMRVLEETKNEERLKDEGLISLTLPKIKTVIVGEVATFGGSDVECEATRSIMKTILASPVRDMICSADIDNRYDVHLEFNALLDNTKLEGAFLVSLGSYSKLEAKLEYIARALERENLEGAYGGNIDVSEEGDKVSIRPVYSSENS